MSCHVTSQVMSHLKSCHVASPHLYLTPHHTSPHLTSPDTSPHLTSPRLRLHLTSPIISHLTSHTSPRLSPPTSPRLSSLTLYLAPHLAYHLISHLTSPHNLSSYLTPQFTQLRKHEISTKSNILLILNHSQYSFSFNRLDLPKFASYHELKEKLKLAIYNTEGFDGVD